VAAQHPEQVAQFETLMLNRFRATHPDREKEPSAGGREAALDFYLRPRDAS
jgi:hypothetical protein